jgi:hypothetical protein
MFQSSDHRYFYEIQTAHSRTLMVFDRCSQRSYTSSNNKSLNARLLARRHKFVTGATLLQLVIHQCMNTAINRTCRASNKCEPPDIPVKYFANQHTRQNQPTDHEDRHRPKVSLSTIRNKTNCENHQVYEYGD